MEINKITLQFICIVQQAWCRQNNFENMNTVEKLRLPAFETYKVTTVIKTLLHCHGETAVGEDCRTQNSELTHTFVIK